MSNTTETHVLGYLLRQDHHDLARHLADDHEAGVLTELLSIPFDMAVDVHDREHHDAA